MSLEIRLLRPEEKEVIWGWVKQTCRIEVDRGSFPETAYVLVNEGRILLHVALIVTNTNLGWLEYFVANPKIPVVGRRQYTKLLLDFVKKQASEFDLTRLFCMAPNAKLKSYYEKLGFYKTARVFTLMTELTCPPSLLPELQSPEA